MVPAAARLVILHGSGGLSDVGRHAVQVALDSALFSVENVVVLTRNPELLQEPNWKCGCLEPHSFSDEQKARLTVVSVDSWETDKTDQYFEGATAVVACLGNRQPFIGGWDSHQGNLAVIRAMKKHKVQRVVVMTSSGVEEDWPPVETFPLGKWILSFLFLTLARKAFQDLTMMEREYRQTEDLDFLLVRPSGLGEDVVPVGKWFIQKEKYKDHVGYKLAKLDAARFMVQEAIDPTLHRQALVLGSDPAD
jgi:hypothetical protein